jgi:hypothetical protein
MAAMRSATESSSEAVPAQRIRLATPVSANRRATERPMLMIGAGYQNGFPGLGDVGLGGVGGGVDIVVDGLGEVVSGMCWVLE